jgi:hypothetical protein
VKKPDSTENSDLKSVDTTNNNLLRFEQYKATNSETSPACLLLVWKKRTDIIIYHTNIFSIDISSAISSIIHFPFFLFFFPKYVSNPYSLVKLMNDECKGDKALFIKKIREIGEESVSRVR